MVIKMSTSEINCKGKNKIIGDHRMKSRMWPNILTVLLNFTERDGEKFLPK